MIIFIFLVQKYPFCVNLTQKFKRDILRGNLVPTLECLIDVQTPPISKLPTPLLPLIHLLIFSHLEHFFSVTHPSPNLVIIAESFQPEFETIYLCCLLPSRKRSDQSAVYFILQVHAKKPTQCFVL